MVDLFNQELNPARLSYAQVAQHHKERLLREKQQNEAAAAAVALQITDNQLEKERRKDTSNASSATIPVEARDNRGKQIKPHILIIITIY